MIPQVLYEIANQMYSVVCANPSAHLNPHKLWSKNICRTPFNMVKWWANGTPRSGPMGFHKPLISPNTAWWWWTTPCIMSYWSSVQPSRDGGGWERESYNASVQNQQGSRTAYKNRYEPIIINQSDGHFLGGFKKAPLRLDERWSRYV